MQPAVICKKSMKSTMPSTWRQDAEFDAIITPMIPSSWLYTQIALSDVWCMLKK